MVLTIAMLLTLAVVPASAAGPQVSIALTADKTTVKRSSSDQEILITVTLNNPAAETDRPTAIGFDLKSADENVVLAEKATSRVKLAYSYVNDDDDTITGTATATYKTIAADKKGIFTFLYGDVTKTLPIKESSLELMTIKATIKANAPVGEYKISTEKMTIADTGDVGVIAKTIYDTNQTLTINVVDALTGDLPVTIPAPVTGGTPKTAISDTNYTGNITWAPAIAAGGKFAANTEYTANVMLTATGSYRFASDVNPTVAGADSVTVENVAADGKTLTFKAEFPKTGNKTLKDIDIITKPELKLAVPTAAPNATATNERSLAVTGVYDDGSGGPVEGTTWKITTDPIPKGVSLDGCTLKVTNEAEAGQVRIEASFTEEYTDAEFVTITKDTPKETAIVATAPATGTNITIPNGGKNTSEKCSYKVYDQYGAEMTGIGATWKMDPATVKGVTVTTDGAIAVENTAETCTVKLHAESGGLKSNEITFNIARAASVAKSLTIEGTADSVNVPTVTEPGTTSCEYATYTAKVKDQYGTEMTGETIEWSVTENPGVTFNNGQLTVTNKANAGTVTITAKSGTLTATKTVTINKAAAKETFVKITAQNNEPPVTLIICTDSQRLESYTATVYDQYGEEKQDEVDWSLDPALSGVTYEISETNDNIVTLKVAPNADAGTFKLVATSKTVNTVKGELEITVKKKTDVSSEIKFDDGSLTYNGAGQKYENASVTAGEGGTWTYTYTAKSGSTGTLDAANLPKTAGTYTVTATYEDSTHVGSKAAVLTIAPKTLTKADLTPTGLTSKVYDGTTNSSITVGVKAGVLYGSDTLSITGSAVYNSANVAEANTITFTPNAITNGNYRLAATEVLTITGATITPKDLTVTPTNPQSKALGEAEPALVYGTPTGAVSGETPAFDGKLERDPGENVGTYEIKQGTLKLKDNAPFLANNYKLVVAPGSQFVITKAAAPTLADITLSQKYTVTSGETVIGTAGMPANAGTLTYAKGTAKTTGTVKVDSWSVDATTGKVTYTLSGGAAGDTVTLPVIIKSTNYADATVKVVITLTKPSSSGGGSGSSHSSRYTITVDSVKHGTITVSPKSAYKGDTVTITVKPDKGYELDTLKVLDKDGDKVKITEKKGKYTFTMPASKVTVKGKFVEEAPKQIFVDVPVDAYCYEAVKWAASEGITGGVGNNLFAPGLPCTRGQIVTFLWRAAGSPAPKSMSSFADVAEDAYYAKAVAWAVENGITGGTGNGKFSPDATCTRAQAVTFLYRASGSPAVSGSAAFSDVAADAYYASAVKWAEKNGITGGIGGGLFGSGNNCTRGQIVTFLYRAMK